MPRINARLDCLPGFLTIRGGVCGFPVRGGYQNGGTGTAEFFSQTNGFPHQYMVAFSVISEPSDNAAATLAVDVPQRNHWNLCAAHRGCPHCSNALQSWKTKASRNGGNAQRLKYALSCILKENAVRVPMEPIVEGMDEVPTHEDIFDKWTCGICWNAHAKVGPHRPVVFMCTHSVCADCYSEESFQRRGVCPYCRANLSHGILCRFST